MGKTTSVRIKEDQMRKMQELSDEIGGTINGFVQIAVKNYIDSYFPVLMEASKQVRDKRSVRKLAST